MQLFHCFILFTHNFLEYHIIYVKVGLLFIILIFSVLGKRDLTNMPKRLPSGY